MASSLPLSGKTAIVTGGSKGIGKATVLQLAKLGANVVINYANDDAAAKELAAQINVSKLTPPQAITVKADVSKVADIEALVNTTVKTYGKIDIVAANAGTLPMVDLEHTSEEIFDTVFRMNVKHPFFLAQKAAPHMPEGSHIVLVSTSLCAASIVTPPYVSYVSSKGAIEQMVRVLSKDLARKGISVNAVAPGPTATELFLKGKSEQMINTLAGANPHNRLGTVEDVAEAFVWLSGEGSRWVTGQVLRANGGMA